MGYATAWVYGVCYCLGMTSHQPTCLPACLHHPTPPHPTGYIRPSIQVPPPPLEPTPLGQKQHDVPELSFKGQLAPVAQQAVAEGAEPPAPESNSLVFQLVMQPEGVEEADKVLQRKYIKVGALWGRKSRD